MRFSMGALLAAFVLLFGGLLTGGIPIAGEGEEVTMIRGWVLDKETGEGIFNASVSAYDDDYTHGYWNYTDEDGYFELVLDEGGHFNIWVSAEEYWDEMVDKIVSTGETVTLDIELEKIECIIFGFILDSDTDETLRRFNLWIEQPRGQSNGYHSYSSSSGEYRIETYEGEYNIHVESSGYEDFETGFIEVLEGDRIEMNISMEPMTTGIKGYVKNEDNEAIRRALVQLENDDGIYQTQTDYHGHYELSPPPGDYELRVHSDDYRPYREDITLEEGVILEKDIELEESRMPTVINRMIYLILLLLGSL